MWIAVDGSLYEGDRQLRGVAEDDSPIYDPASPERPSESHQWDSEALAWVLVVAPLPSRLIMMLDEQAAIITAAIADSGVAPPPGLFTAIAQLSANLQELARLVPEALYASEANFAITNLGVLPEPMETVRQNMLALIQAELP